MYRGDKDEDGEPGRDQFAKNLNAVEWDQHVISEVRYCHSMLFLSIRCRGSRKFNLQKHVNWISGGNCICFL